MEKRKGSGAKVVLGGIIGFVIMFAAVFFGVQFFTKTGIFRIPGVVYYDESLLDTEVAMLSEIFTEEVDLDKDVTITARNELVLPELSEGEFLYQIAVPVTDFYSTETNVEVASVDEMFPNCDCGYELIDVNELDFTKKLLSINDEYYLDTFKSGAVFRIISFTSEKYTEEIEPLVAGEFDGLEFPEADEVLTLAQTGVTALSRRMNTKIAQVGGGAYFAENIGEFLSSFDLTHTSNE